MIDNITTQITLTAFNPTQEKAIAKNKKAYVFIGKLQLKIFNVG